jgi:hypothetical protein
MMKTTLTPSPAKQSTLLWLLLSALGLQPSALSAQGTALTYQGRLTSGTNAANGSYDLTFSLFSVSSGAGQVGGTQTNLATGISNGLFTATLDFGANFPGADRWLEIAVRTNGSGAFTTLAPRQALTATPYAITAVNVTGLLVATQLTGTIPSAQLGGTYSGAVTFNNAGDSFTGDGAGLVNVNASTLGGLSSASFWQLTGNLGTAPGTHFLGTTDNQPLEIKVNGSRAWRVEPASGGAPNLIGGSPVNTVGSGVIGASIGGGGAADYLGSGFAYTNRVDADFGTIGGGMAHTIQTNAGFAVIGGGIRNTIHAWSATIGGGGANTIQDTAPYATLGGGGENTIQANAQYAALGGGFNNTIYANAEFATIAGGGGNRIQTNASYAAIGGGWLNTIQTNTEGATIAGGFNHTIHANAYYATIGGGSFDTIRTNAQHATIAGGYGNQVFGPDAATVGGGYECVASNYAATVSGGQQNKALGAHAAVGGGQANIAEGDDSTCPGGRLNWAKGDHSLAAGNRAKAMGNGAFVWADSQDADFTPGAANEVSFRCENGVVFTKDSGYSKYVAWTPASGSWTFGSDRNSKDHIVPVDGGDVLEKITQLPISEWNYKGYAQRHVGPMAQDFHTLFPLNDDDKTLNEADLHGVALAAIKGLNQKLTEELKRRDTENAELRVRIERLEKLLSPPEKN